MVLPLTAKFAGRIAIIGIGFSEMKEKSQKSAVELGRDALLDACEKANIDPKEIDCLIESSFSKNAISELIRMIQIRPKEHIFSRYVDAGISGYIAVSKIMSKMAKIVAVVGYGKGSEFSEEDFSLKFANPFYLRSLGIDWIQFAALQSKAFLSKIDIGEEELGAIVVKNRKNGIENVNAAIREPITMEEILSSPYVAEPLRLYMLPPKTDGAVAVIFSSDDVAFSQTAPKKIRSWIDGVGISVMPNYPQDLVELKSLRRAALHAYRMADIRNPKREVDFAEIQEFFPHYEVMAIEGLELIAERRLVKPITSGVIFKEGKMPINPSGGTTCTNPPGASGLMRIAEVVKRTSGKVLDLKKSVRRGIASITTPFQTINVVWIIAGE